MPLDHVVLCGGAPKGGLPKAKRPVSSCAWGDKPNVTLRINDVLQGCWRTVPDPLLDLLDVAAYVYAADQAVSRGSDKDANFGEQWRRRLHFAVPVRCPDLWTAPDVAAELAATLGFLSEDEYHFRFDPLLEPPKLERYLNFGADRFNGTVREVMLFSGGLDSLAGAVDAVVAGRQVALVHHRSNDKFMSELGAMVRAGLHAKSRPPILLPVTVNKDSTLTREYTQRTRSFLFAAVGATLAAMLGLDEVHFYENGVVGLNLPPSAQVVGARATRTTHPRVLAGLSRLFSLLAGEPFGVRSPFRWLTKTEVVRRISAAGCADPIARTRSCAHPQSASNAVPHCGVCSQCIDRRFAVLAAGAEAHDPEAGYAVDLLRGPRTAGHPQTMLAVYAETASQVEGMAEAAFFARFGEAARAAAGEPLESVARDAFRLYKRHAEDVARVIDEGLGRHAADVRRRTLPPTCLLEMVRDRGEGEPAAVATPPLPENVFRRRGEVWQVRFEGREAFLLLPSKGAAYLRLLLQRPGTAMRAIDLALAVAKEPGRFALGGGTPLADREAMTAYRASLREIEVAIEQAKRDGNETWLAELEEEKSKTLRVVSAATGLGKRVVKTGDDVERVRKAVGNAIRAAVTKIADYDKPLAAHLKDPTLVCGNDPRYGPCPEVLWET